jgi:hypothetical protein
MLFFALVPIKQIKAVCGPPAKWTVWTLIEFLGREIGSSSFLKHIRQDNKKKKKTRTYMSLVGFELLIPVLK